MVRAAKVAIEERASASGRPALPLAVMIGGGAMVLTLVLMIVLVVRSRGERGEDVDGAAASASNAASSASSDPGAPAREVKLEVDGADIGAWRSRLRAAMEAKDWTTGGKAFLAIAELDPDQFRDPLVREAAVAVATGIGVDTGAISEQVFDKMLNQLGTTGLDLLFEIVRTRGGTKAAKRAEEMLRREDVRDRATPALRIGFDLRTASCTEKSALFQRAVNEGDGRTLAQLQIMKEAECERRSGACCFRDNKELADAIKALKARLGR
jgi:serine/threonine-protein kinase